jgi:histone arginine demethylase JMJD6
MATRTVELARSGDVVVNKKFGMTRDEFRRDHSKPGVPVVLGDATRDWPARELFTFEYFEREFGDRDVEVAGHSYRVAEFIELLRRSSPENPAPYPGKLSLDHHFPELMPHIRPRPSLAVPDRIPSALIPRMAMGQAANYEIFFGSPGGAFPYVHYDYMGLHAFINQLVGEKEFIVVPPWQTEFLYPDPANPWVSRVRDLKNPDLREFPLAAKATVLSFIVGPGETMFIPNGWWHTTVSRTLTLSVAFDLLDDTNWSRFLGEVRDKFRTANPLKRSALLLYLRMLGPVLNAAE